MQIPTSSYSLSQSNKAQQNRVQALKHQANLN